MTKRTKWKRTDSSFPLHTYLRPSTELIKYHYTARAQNNFQYVLKTDTESKERLACLLIDSHSTNQFPQRTKQPASLTPSLPLPHSRKPNKSILYPSSPPPPSCHCPTRRIDRSYRTLGCHLQIGISAAKETRSTTRFKKKRGKENPREENVFSFHYA